MTTAFQPSAFQNPKTGSHVGFQVDYDIRDDGRMSRVSTDASTQLLADQWEIQVESTDLFRARSSADGVNIRIGLLDEDNNRQLVEQITGGKIDEWDITWTPNKITGMLRGRDAASFLLDKNLRVSYLTGGYPATFPEPEALPPGLRPIPGVTTRVYLPGLWRASTIIADLAQRCGLVVNYQAPDYIVRGDLEVSGSALQTIQQLIQPFSYFEPYKVDVWVTGRTLNIRQRQGLVESPAPMGPVPGDLNTVTAHDARITTLSLRARPLDFFRLFRATGRPIHDCGGTKGPWDPGLPGGQFDSEYTQTGNGGSEPYVTTFQRWRIADHATFNVQRSTSRGRETTVYTWEDCLFDENCKLINSPKCTGSQTLIEGTVEGAPGLSQVGRTTTRFFYDAVGFLRSKETLREVLTDTHFGATEKTIESYNENGVKQTVTNRSTYTIDEDGNMDIDSAEDHIGSGILPGGPGRAPRTSHLKVDRYYKAAVIDDVDGAKDFSFTSDSLDQNGLDTIYNQAVKSSGCFEYEVMFTAASIPWVKKGQMFQITGLTDENGDLFDLPAFQIVECRHEYNEADTANPTSLTQIRGAFWSKTWEP